MAIYLVEGPGGSKNLVDTRTQKGAINHVAQKLFKAKALNGAEIVKAVKVDNLEVETIREDDEEVKTIGPRK